MRHISLNLVHKNHCFTKIKSILVYVLDIFNNNKLIFNNIQEVVLWTIEKIGKIREKYIKKSLVI